MVQKGTVAFARVSSGALGAFNSRLNVFGLPYLFDSKQHLWGFLDAPYAGKMLDELVSSGSIGLCWYEAGARSFYARKSLSRMADVKGLRIRTHSNPDHHENGPASGRRSGTAGHQPDSQSF